MIQRLRNRIARSEAEGGFTLIELLVVIIIIGILLAVAVPSYLGFRERAQNTKAQANVRSAVPAVEAYYSDNIGGTAETDADVADDTAATTGYQGMTADILRTKYDAGLAAGLDIGTVTTSTYCIDDVAGAGGAYRKSGPSGGIVAGACP